MANQGIWRERFSELFNEAECFIVPSNYIADRLTKLSCPVHKINVFHYGVDIDEWSRIKNVYTSKVNGTRTLLIVGRLVEKKGILDAIRALQKIVNAGHDVRLLIVGEGPQRSEIEKLISEFNLQSYILLLGSKPNKYVADLMKTSHMLIAPSITTCVGETEGLPVSIVEASAAGLPVIATYHAGIPEVIRDGLSGFLVKEKDFSALADKIITLMRDPELANKMGKAGRQIVEKEFNIKESVQSLENIYSKLIMEH
jgi:colanic acid/amylovoran biosynthesis glycosyltransferase